jgi:hypothetical protein
VKELIEKVIGYKGGENEEGDNIEGALQDCDSGDQQLKLK